MIQVSFSGLHEAQKQVQGMAEAIPGASARALNAAMQSARELIVQAAQERYAFSEAGARHLQDLRVAERAAPNSLSGKVIIRKLKSDMGYYETSPKMALMGGNWRLAPREGFSGHVLRSTGMVTLPGGAGRSKAFLLHFQSGHVGMVERVLFSESRNTVTARGKPRWKNKYGFVEKVETLGSLSTAAQSATVWPDQEREAAEAFFQELTQLLQAR